MKKIINKIDEKLIFLYSFIITIVASNTNLVFGATDLINNPVTNGFKELLKDGLKVIMLIATVALPFFIALYQFKKKASDDEMEGKQYDKKTKAVIICYIIIMSASLIVAILAHYFKISGTPV